FDLSYNFCKVFVDGDWLTTILANKQFNFINEIKLEGRDEHFKLTNLITEGTFFDFLTPFKIVALGSSTTANRNSITGVYCQRLPEHFKNQNIPVHIFNEGIGGNTTRAGRKRFDKDVLTKMPDFVIINLGINDSWVDS